MKTKVISWEQRKQEAAGATFFEGMQRIKVMEYFYGLAKITGLSYPMYLGTYLLFVNSKWRGFSIAAFVYTMDIDMQQSQEIYGALWMYHALIEPFCLMAEARGLEPEKPVSVCKLRRKKPMFLTGYELEEA